ncbi:MAG TPA: hypothetical protein VEY08_07530 [Chloroflexia bacterium]|nr:hypothetical protein [Chloroflexia bacterium]
MSANIELQLDTGELHLTPGESAEVLLTLTNRSDVVDLFRVAVVGLDHTWYVLTASEVRLFPGDAGKVTLRVNPRSGVMSGVYPFNVLVSSQDNPGEQTMVGITLAIASAGELALDLQPKKVHGRKGLFAVMVGNPGNAPRTVVIGVTDREEALNYSLGTPVIEEGAVEKPPSAPVFGKAVAQGQGVVEYELEVPAGGAATVPLLLKPGKRIWTGNERAFSFSVVTHPPGVEWEPREARRVEGQLLYRPPLAAWSGLPLQLRRALAVALPLLLFVLIIAVLLQVPSMTENRLSTMDKTATAIAAATATARNGLSVGDRNATEIALAVAALTQVAMTSVAMTQVAKGEGTPTAVAGVDTNGDGRPVVNRLWLALPSTETSDGTLKEPDVKWEVSPASAVVVGQSSRPFELGEGGIPARRIDYTLVATDSTVVATNSLSILVIEPPTIEGFVASPVTVVSGQGTTLSWKVTGGTSGTVDGKPVDLGPGGSGGVGVVPPGTHIYIFCVSNPAGPACRTVRVTVIPESPTPTFTAVPQPPTPTNTVPPAQPSATRTPIPAATPTLAVPATATPTIRVTATSTATRVATNTAAPTATATATSTATSSPTATETASATPTSTPTPTPTPTNTTTPTYMPTSTPTYSPTATSTTTRTPTPTLSPTPSVPACQVFMSDDVPKSFPPYGTVRSILNISRTGTISDVNVVNLDIAANFRPFDLYLYSPAGARMHIVSWDCGDFSTRLTINLDDEATASLPNCGPQTITGTYKSYRTPFSTVDGSQAAGTWVLELDLGPGREPEAPEQQNSQLLRWGLEVCYKP